MSAAGAGLGQAGSLQRAPTPRHSTVNHPQGPRSRQRGTGEAAAWSGGVGCGRAHLCADAQAGTWRGAAGERAWEGRGESLGPTSSPAPLPQFGAIHVRCLLTPGHTLGHMSYFLWEEECPDPPAVFSGTGCPVPTCPTSPCPIPLSLTHPTPQGMHCPWPAAAHVWRAQLSRCTRAWWRPWAPCPPRQ